MIRGIRTRLALALLVVVAGALVVAWATVVPSLENRLIKAKLDQLRGDALPVALNLPDRVFWQEYVEQTEFLVNARIVVYDLLTTDPVALTVAADSRTGSSRDVERDITAQIAAATGRTQGGTTRRNDKRVAEIAIPLDPKGPVVLFISPLRDSLATVRLVERRLLGAGALALLVAGVLGYLGASFHAHRIRRLERAAERIAGGRFDEPVVDGGSDELGELASAFERMREQLAHLDTARKEFIANASHELRTPLFSLGGFLELMTDEELDEETRDEFLVTMREQVDRLTKLATDLLDLSRVDAGRLHLEQEVVDLTDLARALLDEMRPLAARRGHPVRELLEPGTIGLGDEQRVLQVGRSLLGNALVHTPVGTPVTVRVGHRDGFSFLAVEDQGPGVPPEHVPHVFERFYRIEGDLASGSGLGLAIARELADLMGGKMELETRPGRTIFRLVLDAAPPVAPDTPASSES